MSAKKPETNPDTKTAPEANGQQPAGGLYLSDEHYRMLVEESAIDPEVIRERGYYTVTKRVELRRAGFSDYQSKNLNLPGIIMPLHTVAGTVGLNIYRPDVPAPNKDGKLAKYVMPSGCEMALDVPPRCLENIGDPGVMAVYTEGIKKVDSAVSRGLNVYGLLGVWNWRHTNKHGGKVALPDFESVALNDRPSLIVFDSDIMQKLPVYKALLRLRDFLRSRGTSVRVAYLPSKPDGSKMGLDDWFAEDPTRTIDDLMALSQTEIKPTPNEMLEATAVADALEDAPAADGLTIPLGYEVRLGGITKVDIDPYSETGRETRKQITRAPVIIGGSLEDLHTGEEAMVLQYPRHGVWRKATVERSTAMNARELVNLSGRGLPVTSGRAGGLVEYLDAYEAQNRDRIPRAMVSDGLGWLGERGVLGYLCGYYLIRPGCEPGVGSGESVEDINPADWGEDWVSFRGADTGDEQVAAAFKPGGTYEGWLEAIQPIAAYPRVMLAFYAGLAPPLLEVLGAANFVVDLAHPSSRGKTSSLRVAGSSWGVVKEQAPESVIHSWRATRAWIDRTSSLLSGLPLILDETNRATDPRAIPETLYDVANGRGKGRGSVKGTRRTGSWRTVLLSSGEYPAVHRSEDEGTHARTLTVMGEPFERADDATGQLVSGINEGLAEHYGHAGPRLVRYLVEHRDNWETWREEYREIRRGYVEASGGNPVVGRMADYFAVLDMTARLADEALGLPWGDLSPVEPLYDDLVAQAANADKAREAMVMLAGWANANAQKFRGRERTDANGESIPPNEGFAGRWDPSGDWSQIAFYPDRLRELLRRWEYDPDSTLAAWRSRGWLDSGGDSRRTKKKVSVVGQKVWMVVLRREAFDPDGAADAGA